MTDDLTLTEFARAHRLKAAAVLVQIAEDENASPQSRQAAAQQILAYSDGKPGQARQLTVGDLATMPDDLRQQLLEALLTHYMPGGFAQLLKSACDDAVAKFAALQAALPKPNRFKRGPLSNQPAKCLPCDSSANLDPGAIAHAPLPTSTLDGVRSANSLSELESCDNVVPFAENSATARSAPYGLKFGLAEDLPADSAPGKGNGSIHPHVVYRSTLKDPLAFDTAFFNGRTTKPV